MGESIVGRAFGKLLVLQQRGYVRVGKQRIKKSCCLCQCQCGDEIVVVIERLVSGNTTSCGCEQRRRAKLCSTTHGHTQFRSRTSTYGIWRGMKSRCQNPNTENYYLYGGRGIAVCARWQEFNNFLADMGARPNGLTLDRIDVNGNYEPGNCRWATVTDQNNNRRNSRHGKDHMSLPQDQRSTGKNT